MARAVRPKHPPYATLIGMIAAKNISYADIADAVGLSYKNVWDRLNGFVQIKTDEAIAIRNAFFPGWKIEDLFSSRILEWKGELKND